MVKNTSARHPTAKRFSVHLEAEIMHFLSLAPRRVCIFTGLGKLAVINRPRSSWTWKVWYTLRPKLCRVVQKVMKLWRKGCEEGKVMEDDQRRLRATISNVYALVKYAQIGYTTSNRSSWYELWNFRSHVLSLPGTFAPWNFRSLELSLPRAKMAWNFCSPTRIISDLYRLYFTEGLRQSFPQQIDK